VDEELARWWDEEQCAKDITDATWYDFNTFLHGCILSPRRKVSCTKPVKAVKQLPRIESMSIPSHAKEATTVVLVQLVSMAMTKSSEEKQPDVTKVVMCIETTVEEVEPLSGLNMQLERVCDETCKPVDKRHRWSLFQTQCMIKGKSVQAHGGWW
jgi:hypothetical protein